MVNSAAHVPLASTPVDVWSRAVLGALSFGWLCAAAAERPFTVDIMVQTEGVGEVLFGPDGKRLLMERTAAYESSRNFAWLAWSRERATLLSIALDGQGADHVVSPQDRDGVWIGSYSPRGRRAAIGWFDGDSAKAGVYDFESGALGKLDFRVGNAVCAFDCPFWLSEDTFIHYALSADEQKKKLSAIAYTDDLARRWARQGWTGKEAAVKVLGSGAYQNPAIDDGGQLIEVDALTGRTSLLGEGVFWELSLSPDRRRFAALRETGDLDLTGARAAAIIGADKILELAVYDFTRKGARVLPCEGCNVTRDSLRWSPDGGRLFFGARILRGGEQLHLHYIYDFRRGRLARFEPTGVEFTTEENLWSAAYVTPFLWLDENTPAVRIERTASSRDKKRYDWFAVPPGRAPVKLTEGIEPEKDKRPLEDYVAAHKGRLLMMADGELWSVAANGRKRNLTQNVTEKLSPWCSVFSHWRDTGTRPICSGFRIDNVIRPVDAEALKQGWMTFRIVRDEVPSSDLLFLNIDTGQIARISSPDDDADIVTASAATHSAVYRCNTAFGDRLLLTSVGMASRELLHFNRQLAGVMGGKPIMLTRREPGEDEDRYDWLLLPPDHRPGQHHPLLVYFYPDRKYSKEWRGNDLRDINFLNMHIPAAHGYAVLLPSMKISSRDERGNPMVEMHEQLIRAAENVVKEGYADPQRWAIMGHSYGGYGTLSVITQTRRFKAAVAMNGPVNLTSNYAAGLAESKATDVVAGLSFGAMWSEGGQGRMGVPPWQDPQRYIDNSPLFHVDKIATPLILVHGDYDFVNVNESEQMFNALHRLGKDALFLRYWGEGHSIQSPANIRDMWGRIFEWFERHLDVGPDEGQGGCRCRG